MGKIVRSQYGYVGLGSGTVKSSTQALREDINLRAWRYERWLRWEFFWRPYDEFRDGAGI